MPSVFSTTALTTASTRRPVCSVTDTRSPTLNCRGARLGFFRHGRDSILGRRGNRRRRVLHWPVVFAFTIGIPTRIPPTICTRVAGIVNRFSVAATARLSFGSSRHRRSYHRIEAIRPKTDTQGNIVIRNCQHDFSRSHPTPECQNQFG